jgi:hypothetical protein
MKELIRIFEQKALDKTRVPNLSEVGCQVGYLIHYPSKLIAFKVNSLFASMGDGN